MPHLTVRRKLEFGNFKFLGGGVWGGGGDRGEKQKQKFLGGCLIREVFLLSTIGHPLKLEMEDSKNFQMP